MDWSKSIDDTLPAPRDDEPASLRKDIEDELRDHLQSALRRQLLQTPDAERARGIVLDRFGDPRAIARQLWFDALKEKIMSQRLMVGLTMVTMLVCVASLGMTMRAIDRGHQASLALLAESQKMNEAVITRLEKLSAAPTPVSLEWNTVKIPLASSDPTDRHYPKGCKVSLKGHVLDPSRDTSVEGILVDDGVDFGLLRTGRHTLIIKTAWGEWSIQEIDIRPGQSQFPTVVVPGFPAEKGEITFAVDLPDDLREKKLGLALEVAQLPRKFGTGEWRGTGVESGVVLKDDGFVISFPSQPRTNATPEPFQLMNLMQGSVSSIPGWQLPVRIKTNGGYFTIEDIPAAPFVEWPVWPAVAYQVKRLLVLKNPGKIEKELCRFTVVGGMVDEAALNNLAILEKEPTSGNIVRKTRSGFVPITSENRLTFDIDGGDPKKRWNIKLPEDLLETLRSALVSDEVSEKPAE